MVRPIALVALLLALLAGAFAQDEPVRLEATHVEQPRYPKEAREKGISGRVMVAFELDEKGKVVKAEALSGNPLLQPAAIEAVQKYRFKPVKLNGHAVSFTGKMPIDFGAPPPYEVERVGPDGRPTRIRATGPLPGAKLIKHVNPEYPILARQQHLQGTVTMDALVGTDGLVKEVQVTSGPQMLREAAKSAVEQWQYEPLIIDGSPVEVRSEITVNFTLAGS
jgi:TonB family protein